MLLTNRVPTKLWGHGPVEGDELEDYAVGEDYEDYAKINAKITR